MSTATRATLSPGSVPAQDAVAQIAAVEPDGVTYDTKVKVLAGHVRHHVEEKQNEMLPKIKASSLDHPELGARMAARKAKLLR